MNRKVYSIIVMLLIVVGGMAEPISENEALAIAGRFCNSNSTMQKAPGKNLKLAAATKGYYAFNRGECSGFVIVAADDNAAVEVLGYADDGTFDVDNMPENMKWWLSEYTRQMEYAAAHPASNKVRAQTLRANIGPLLTCCWDQSAPFNNYCPQIGSERCVTGCVATATAQIMYYHKWPERGTGTHSYTWNSQTLAANFNKAYQWDEMLDRYNSNSPTESCNAVAELMSDVGISINMMYNVASSGGSGAYNGEVASALPKYFGYDKGAVEYQRDFYYKDEWEDLLYTGLSYGPILYGGSGDGGGHAFVCDGYKDGYFHFNWGWSGNSNGYFALTALDPDNQGAGGNSAGYNYGQGAITKLAPDVDGDSEATPLLYCDGFSTTTTKVSYTDAVSFKGWYYNYGTTVNNFWLGIKVVDEYGNATYLRSQSYYNIKAPVYPYIYRKESQSVSMANFPRAAGRYIVSPVYCEYKDTNPSESDWIDMHYEIANCSGKLTATVENENIIFSEYVEPNCQLTASRFDVTSGDIYAGKIFAVSADITATGNNYYGDVIIAVLDGNYVIAEGSSQGRAIVDLNNGDCVENIEFKLKAPTAAGNYILVIADKSGLIIATKSITVSTASSTGCTISVNSLTIDNPGFVDADKMRFTASITNTGGYGTGTLYLFIFPKNGGTSLACFNKFVIFNGNETKNVDFTGSFEDGEEGTEYFAWLVLNGGFVGPRCEFTLANKVDREIPASGYASFSSVYNVKVPEGITVYKARINGDKVLLKAVDEPVIPANTGVILYSEICGARTFVSTSAPDNADFAGNELIPTSVEANATIPATGLYYALKANALEFARLKNGIVLSQNKAYIKAAENGAKALSVAFDDGVATGISTVDSDEKADGAYYTLQGVKVTTPSKGVYIRNGKKVLVK